MTLYHAVLIDETGCEFGAEVEAASRAHAYNALEDRYPESRIDQLESPDDRAAREHDMYARLLDDDFDHYDDDY